MSEPLVSIEFTNCIKDVHLKLISAVVFTKEFVSRMIRIRELVSRIPAVIPFVFAISIWIFNIGIFYVESYSDIFPELAGFGLEGIFLVGMLNLYLEVSDQRRIFREIRTQEGLICMSLNQYIQYLTLAMNQLIDQTPPAQSLSQIQEQLSNQSTFNQIQGREIVLFNGRITYSRNSLDHPLFPFYMRHNCELLLDSVTRLQQMAIQSNGGKVGTGIGTAHNAVFAEINLFLNQCSEQSLLTYLEQSNAGLFNSLYLFEYTTANFSNLQT